MMIVAHRGASRDAPENTIAAFELAWQQGADAIEGDFQLTADGQIVCIHDSNTKRVATVDMVVCESTLADLRKLDMGAHRSQAFRGNVIPTMTEVFATIPDGKKIYIEIKCGIEIVPVLLKEFTHSGLREEQIVIISFREEVIRDIKQRVPQIKALWLYHFDKEMAAENHPDHDEIFNRLQQMGADGLSSSYNVPHSFVKTLRERGYEWHVWTVDDITTAQSLVELGTDSITTNRPGYMKANLVTMKERL